jgi:LysM repeat protein
MRRIFYEVKSGDNLSDIARAYGVPREQIVQLNNLPNGGQTIQIGQIIEIPNDMRLDDSLPPIAESTTSLSP